MWKELWDGVYGFKPRTIGDLRRLSNLLRIDFSGPALRYRAVVLAAKTLLSKLPKEWLAIWPGTRLIASSWFSGSCFDQVKLHRAAPKPKHFPVSNSVKNRYTFLVEGRWTKANLLEHAIAYGKSLGLDIDLEEED